MKLTTVWEAMVVSGTFKQQISLDDLRKDGDIAAAIGRAARVDHAAIWKSVLGSLAERCQKLLDPPVEKRIVEAFAEYRELLQYTDPGFPPDKEVERRYERKTVKIEMAPKLELHVDGQKISTLNLKATLEPEVRGLVLTIQGGRIRRLTAAQVVASGKLQVEGVQVYKTPEARIFEGFKVEPREGVPIAPWKRDASLAATAEP